MGNDLHEFATRQGQARRAARKAYRRDLMSAALRVAFPLALIAILGAVLAPAALDALRGLCEALTLSEI